MSDSARLYRGSLSPEEAVRMLCEGVAQQQESETLPLKACVGRILTSSLTATADLPATNNAAVDGYAVKAAFLEANPDFAFRVIGRAAAGHPFNETVGDGQAVRIFTGGVMPDGADVVAMHEFCQFDEQTGTVTLTQKLKSGANNRPAGENLQRGETIITAGTRLGTADIGIAAAAGFATLSVTRRLRVGLMSMGDEVVETGHNLAPGHLHDSNRPMLTTMLEGDGHEVVDYGIVGDSRAALTDAYSRALADCDAVLSSGGASDGDEDHTQSAMADNNVDPVFWRLAIKPGRPMSGGILRNGKGGKPILCLPGNPVAAYVCFRLAAAPVLSHMIGATPRQIMKLPVKSGFAHRKSAGRTEYLRVRIEDGEDGLPVMQLHGRKGAGVLSSLTGAHGLVEIPVDNEGVAVGDWLRFIPFRETGL